MNLKKYIVEAIGTCALSLVVLLSLTHFFPISTPILAGLVLMLFVYSIGHISGTHINPAVTLGLYSIKKIKGMDAVYYIIAQIVGAYVALLILSLFGGVPMVLTVASTWAVFFAELIGMFVFTFGIASVVYGNTPSAMSGVVVGGSLLLGITFAALLGSNGVLNPAVAIAIKSFNLVYLLGPIVGSVLGMNVYRILESKK